MGNEIPGAMTEDGSRFAHHELLAVTLGGTLVPQRSLLHPMRPLKYKLVSAPDEVYEIVDSETWHSTDAENFHLKKVGIVGLLDSDAKTLIAQRVFAIDSDEDQSGPFSRVELCPPLSVF